MIYCCRACQHEEARGCLPTATCGLYLMGLLSLAGVGVVLAARLVRGLLGPRPAPAEPVAAPWWVDAVAVAVGVGLTLVGAVVLRFLLELVEWLAFAWRRCPACGARRWSWGFTRGFGV